MLYADGNRGENFTVSTALQLPWREHIFYFMRLCTKVADGRRSTETTRLGLGRIFAASVRPTCHARVGT